MAAGGLGRTRQTGLRIRLPNSIFCVGRKCSAKSVMALSTDSRMSGSCDWRSKSVGELEHHLEHRKKRIASPPLPAVVKRRMRQREAADRLGLTALQVRRLLQRDRRSGPAVRVSRRHDQDSGNPIPVAAQKAMLERIRERYPDVPAKLAWESWYSRTDRDGLRQEPTIIVLG